MEVKQLVSVFNIKLGRPLSRLQRVVIRPMTSLSSESLESRDASIPANTHIYECWKRNENCARTLPPSLSQHRFQYLPCARI